jgi:hypothetical protein
VPQHYIAFGEDPFGNQFFYDSTKNESPVYGLLLQDAVMVTMANAIDEFLVKLLDERLRDAILNYSFYIDCLTNGVDHKAGHHLTLKVPRVLGGNEKMGIVDVEAITNVSYLGQLIEQTKDLSPEERASRVRFSTE